MSNVRIDVGGRSYELAVRAGQEANFRELAALVDARGREAARAAGGLTEVRQLLFAALMLADEVNAAAAITVEHATLRAHAEAIVTAHDTLADEAAALREEVAALRAERDALAAELSAHRKAAPPPPDPAAAIAIERLAARVEAYADGLEKARPAP